MSVEQWSTLCGWLPEIRWADLSPDGRERIRIALLNVVLGALAASGEDEVGWLDGYSRRRGRGSTPVWGSDLRLTPEDAAFANGTLAHLYAYDDTMDVLIGHPGPTLLPALMAAGHGAKRSLADMAVAFSGALELMVRLAEAMNPAHYIGGFHATSTLGCMGSAAAVSMMTHGDSEHLREALSIAASLVCGIRVNVGTSIRPAHAGWAARSGIVAVEFVDAGLRGHSDAIDGPLGLVHVFGGQPDHLDARRGLAINEARQLNLKKYPCCGASAPVIDAIGDIKRSSSANLRPEDVAEILVSAAPLVHQVLPYHDPRTPEEARFSLEYATVVGVLDDRVGPASFSVESNRRVRASGLLSRIRIEVREFGATKYETEVRLETADGRAQTARRGGVGGTPVEELDSGAILERWSDVLPSWWLPDRLTSLLDADWTAVGIGDVNEVLVRN